MNGIYLTQKGKQEIKAKIAKLETGLKTLPLTDGFKDMGMLSVYEEILSSATIIEEPLTKKLMKNVHLLPTDKPDFVIFKNRHLGDRLFHWNMDLGNPMNRLNYVGQNIYITNNEEIKDGGYVFWEGKIYKCRDFMKMRTPVYTDYFSIILTTDQDLIKDGVQPIGDEFLEWFVKNPTCEYVEIKQPFTPSSIVYGINTNLYKIIIPQEEAPEISFANEIKQISDYGRWYGRIEGAKWQAERMYSEEEVYNLLKSMPNFFKLSIVEQEQAIKDWFKQFKKK